MRDSGEEGAECVVGEGEGGKDEGRRIESAVVGKRIEDRPIRVRDAESPAVRRVVVEDMVFGFNGLPM
jgi:hypothetical protein